MSTTTINIFPNTDIIVNGDVPYTFTSNDTSRLKHIELKPKVSSESINVDLSGISFESVAIEDGTDLGEHTLQWITTSMTNQTWSNVQNRALTCDDSIKDTYMDELRFLVSKGYNIRGVRVYEIYYDAARWINKTDTNSLSTDGKIETQTYSYFYKYRLRRYDGQAIDPVLLANLSVYIVDDGGGYEELTTSQFIHGKVFDTGYSQMTMAVYLNESITVEGAINLSVNWYNSFEDQEIYSNITGFLKVQVRDTRDDSVVAEYDVPIDTARQNVIDTLTLAGSTSITSTTPVVYTLSKTWVNNNSHKYEDLQIHCSAPTSKVSVSWVVPGESFQLEVPQDYTNHNVSLYVYDRYQDRRVWPGCKSNTLTIDVDVTTQQARTVTYDLNNNWMASTYSHPSDSMGMAMFQSESNHNVSGTTATMYIRYSASNTPDEVAVFICSNSEPGYDYTKIYALDSESTVATDTSSHQGTPSGLLSTNYVRQNYTIPGDNQTHFIRIDYYKDSSGNMRDDRGFVCVAPIDGQVVNPYTPQVPVASVDISEVVYMGNGTYEFDVEVSPVNADTSALRFDPWYTCNFTSSSMDLDQTWTDTGYGTIKTKGHMYFTGLVSNSGQFCIVLKSGDDPGIFDEETVTVGNV